MDPQSGTNSGKLNPTVSQNVKQNIKNEDQIKNPLLFSLSNTGSVQLSSFQGLPAGSQPFPILHPGILLLFQVLVIQWEKGVEETR